MLGLMLVAGDSGVGQDMSTFLKYHGADFIQFMK